MVKCWEKSPKDRPSFSEIYKEVTKFIERAAGYLDISFNPFTKEQGDLYTSHEILHDIIIILFANSSGQRCKDIIVTSHILNIDK